MADLFELKGVNIELKIRGQVYKFADPEFLSKLASYKASEELEAVKKDISHSEYMARANELNKASIKMYLPDIPQDVLDKIGMNEMSVLLDKIAELTGENFGAVVEKVEKK